MKVDVDREKDEEIATLKRQKTALVNQNDELMAKLKTAEAQIRNNFIVNLTITDLCKPWSGNSENVVCSERIKELESLVETSDLKVNTLEDQLKKCLNMHEDLQNNVELMARLKNAQTQIRDCKTACNLKVDFIEGLLLREQSENFVCSKRIKEQESLVETSAVTKL
ncbi:unnamed protein product [Pleuronectes platessa]|uniref:Uncharacterized protein n=1 Tax=Pleuronectes platessa TaxID=8262 RepID=A0A9N7VI73_PLEPL|nr:unnamed protein product [Pleuronectes platessa]